jgi:hypothetical protein
MGQTVNLLAYAYGGSNPSRPTLLKLGINELKSTVFCNKTQFYY